MFDWYTVNWLLSLLEYQLLIRKTTVYNVAVIKANVLCSVPLRQTTSATHVGRGGSANIFNPNSTIPEVTFNATSNTALKTNESAVTTASNTAVNTGSSIAITLQETAEQKKARLAYERSIKGLANIGKEWLMGKKN
jgi:hypothetical protein